MVIDSSAIIAILFDEPESTQFAQAIEADPVRQISTANYLETSIVVSFRTQFAGERQLDHFLLEAGIEIIPVELEQAEIARTAYRRYGKGNHPAALNFGDCFSYALSYTTGEPLLFKGNDFSQTDIRICELT